ncbi:MAG: radical SAM protein [Calditrichaeota bacterium]|nr:radical SAM protein [Calditrichota bacterium]
MKINEIFHSIQGESSFAGQPCIFIRTTYCNLRCSYCDTKYAYYEGDELSIDEIIEQISEYPSKLVELTGGEPLLQSDIDDLANRLLDMGYTVLCETSGSINIDRISHRVHRIVDIKTPGSGESDKNELANLEKLTDRDELKFVICSRADYDWSRDFISQYSLQGKKIFFSPEHDHMNRKQLAEWILEDGLPVRFQVQLHKFIWHPEMRGV